MAIEPHLDAWIEQLCRRGGTDILLTAGSAPLLRVDGRLLPLAEAGPLSGEDIEDITRGQFPEPEGDGQHFRRQYVETLHGHRELDFSFPWRDQGRVRAARSTNGSARCPSVSSQCKDPFPEELGLPPAIVKMLRGPRASSSCSPVPASGKSTTLASMIDYINARRRLHILTLEDPVEYVHSHKLSAVNQREVGFDTNSFARGLRAALREDPDVVLVGEMRDPESISVALSIAETGHLVFATLHTNDTAQALDRIVDVFPAERQAQIRVQLAGTLLAVVYQRLLPEHGGGLVAAIRSHGGRPRRAKPDPGKARRASCATPWLPTEATACRPSSSA